MMLKNDRLIKALNLQPVDKIPIWLMRQAGRYLPEYMEVRKQAGDFLTLCKTPKLACEVTLQPLRRFDLDAGIVFSDILTIPDALGLGLSMQESVGPVFSKPTATAEAIDKLPELNVAQELNYVFEAIDLIKSKLNYSVPLLGFAGSPWTVATYMIEGKATKTFSVIKKMLYQTPTVLLNLLEKLSVITVQYLILQIKAGADAVMLFDTWGGVLTETAYKEFSLNFMGQIIQQIKQQLPNIPVIIFSKNGGKYLQAQAATNCNAIGLDWTADLKLAKQLVGAKVALQGNLDPAVLYADKSVIELQVNNVLQQFTTTTGAIFNLGHGIYPDISPDNVTALVNAVNKLATKENICA